MIDLLAQTSASWTLFAQYGVLGIGVLVLGKFAYDAFNHERERADRLEGLNQELYKHISEEVVPLTTRAVIALERLADEVDTGDKAEKPKPRGRQGGR